MNFFETIPKDSMHVYMNVPIDIKKCTDQDTLPDCAVKVLSDIQKMYPFARIFVSDTIMYIDEDDDLSETYTVMLGERYIIDGISYYPAFNMFVTGLIRRSGYYDWNKVQVKYIHEHESEYRDTLL
jgi:hypothetical protein